MKLDDKISSLYGVGPKNEKILNMNGLGTIENLLYYYPRAYQNRADVHTVAYSFNETEPHSYILTIANEPRCATLKGRLNLLKVKAFDDTGTVTLVYYNQNYLKDVFKIGMTFRFYGKITSDKKQLVMNSPSYEVVSYDKPLAPLVPIYPLFSNINQKFLYKTISQIIPHINELVEDYIPENTRLENKLCTLPFALSNIHFPDSVDSLNKAIRRLTFDELFLFALSVSQIKKVQNESMAPTMKKSDIGPFISSLPYELTTDQEKVIYDIVDDLCGSDEEYKRPMNRIVVGDVGSGKTICACAAAYISCINGFQCALMVPTEILAFQHFNDIEPLFSKFGFRTVLLTGSTPKKEKERITNDLINGDIDFIIGTHALIQKNVEFKNLGLVITDEQHRFGVMQRASLAEKNKNSHVLVMSATPIPRTLSLIIYGDLDISKINTMPHGRQKVSTFVVDSSYRDRLNGFIRKQVENGHQVYIVCPSIEEKEKKEDIDSNEFNPFLIFDEKESDLKSAVEYEKNLSENIFPDLRISLLHGKMKPKEKDQIMLDFSNGKIDILVSTTVIEVGVNVPNATLMVVENAERFGLSQLHQLRGRVGRGKDKSYCILVSDSKSENGQLRLETMHKVHDGYKIAEQDLKMRGPGDFFSSSDNLRQSGESSFNISKTCTDEELLSSAFDSAKQIFKEDKNLAFDSHYLLKKQIEKICSEKSKTIN